MPSKKIPRNAYLNPRFGAAVKEFGLELKKTGNIRHTGGKGTAREKALVDFFADKMPDRFAVVSGEAVDSTGNSSPQLDLMFFDKSINFALSADAFYVLPAEALLASVEVKSELNTGELAKSVEAARRLRELRPFGKPLKGTQAAHGVDLCRYYHCLFAYQTNLTTNWLEGEFERVAAACAGEHLIDLVYVVDKGLLNVTHQMARMEDDEGGAITEFYFSILNFIQREAGRRRSVPIDRYTKPTGKWIKLVAEVGRLRSRPKR